eukprot:4747948-Amphidinium_carterae.1
MGRSATRHLQDKRHGKVILLSGNSSSKAARVFKVLHAPAWLQGNANECLEDFFHARHCPVVQGHDCEPHRQLPEEVTKWATLVFDPRN